MKKLGCVLLIDDDESTNFINEFVIDNEDCAEEIVSTESGEDALNLLKPEKDPEPLRPDLIFLDVNMPGMNGWEFLQEYEQLPQDVRENSVVVVLTTSPNPDDKQRAETFPEVKEFINKPLTGEMLHEIITDHF